MKDSSRMARTATWAAVASLLAGGRVAAQTEAADPPAAAASAAPAASSPEGRNPAAPTTLDQIIVTATKRSSTVQKTPISMSALSEADLEQRGLAGVSALVGEVPGISIKSSGPGQTEFELRGMTSSGGSSPTTGFYLDDTPLTAPAAAQNGKVVIDPNLYDLNRIEVLRGPQGTLYGSGSMGGTIKLVTNQPNLTQREGSAQITLSGTEGGGFNHAENAMVNVPLVDHTLAMRIVASEGHTSGWIDRVVLTDLPVSTTGLARGDVANAPEARRVRDVNDQSSTGARLTLLYKPDDRWSITPMLFVQSIRQGGPNTYDSDPGTLAHYEAFDDPEPFKDRFSLSSVTVNGRFDGFELTSATSYWSRSEQIRQDQAENFQQVFGLPSTQVAAGGIGGGAIAEQDQSRQFAEEVRLTSTGDTRFQWLVGAFYSRFSSAWDLQSEMPGAAALFGTANLYNQTQPTRIAQRALFGETSYKLTPEWKATVGLRYFSYVSTVDTTYSGFASPSGSDTVVSSHANQSSQGYNPRLNLSFQATDDVMLYTTAARGFRPGGGNQPIPTNPESSLGAACLSALQAFGQNSAPTTFKPDDVWSYEIGEKASIGRRITVNASLYHESWKGVQQTVALSCGFPYTDNTGDAAIYGGEIEARAVVAQGLVLSANAGYTDAYLTSDVPQTGGHKGDRLQSISPWTASSALAYTRPISDDLEGFMRLSYDYVGPRIDATFYPNNHLPSYSLVGLRAGVNADAWSATLFANNLLNKHAAISDTTSISINLPTFNRVSTNQPLTVGLDVSFRFK